MSNKINRLNDEPEFYNTLTTNCTTDVVALARALGSDMRYSWKVVLSGYAPEYAYELGKLDSQPAVCRTAAAQPDKSRGRMRVGDDPEFSIKIREGLPMPQRR